MPKKYPVADTALNAVLALSAVTALVLLCVYAFHGPFRKEEPAEPIIIGAEETQPPVTVTTTAAATTTAPELTTEETTSVTVLEVGEYTSSFFENALFIGDSLSVGFINYEFLKPENVFAQAGINPTSIATTEIDGVTVYQKAAQFDPDYICIMLGTNGLSHQTSEDMAEKMGVLIDDMRRICPNAKIVLITVPPVTKAHEEEKPETLELVLDYNEYIRVLAEEKAVALADAYELLRDDEGYLASDYAEQDGLHLKIYAYPVILSTVENAFVEYYGVEIPPETEPPETEDTETENTETTE